MGTLKHRELAPNATQAWRDAMAKTWRHARAAGFVLSAKERNERLRMRNALLSARKQFSDLQRRVDKLFSHAEPLAATDDAMINFIGINDQQAAGLIRRFGPIDIECDIERVGKAPNSLLEELKFKPLK
jgi:hypothetical protein